MGNTYDTEIARIEADHIQTRWRTTEDYRWGYTGDRGPETWWVHFPSASGGMQSPVDIITEETIADFEFGPNPLQIFYYVPQTHGTEHSSDHHDTDEKRIMINTGSTIRTNIVNTKSYITGGPCRNYTYVLEQFHIHWGESDTAGGSEHHVNSRSYAAELHLVHWNEDLFSCYEDAVKSDEGIIILAVFLQLSDSKCNEPLFYMSNLLDDLAYRDQNVLLQPGPGEFMLRSLLPDDLNQYWTYDGSFCTPPCYETVQWIIFEKPSYITPRVLKKFRGLHTYCENEARPVDDPHEGFMLSNRRPTQPIGTRKVAYVDCLIWREHHHPDDGWRPFRCRGVGDGPRNNIIKCGAGVRCGHCNNRCEQPTGNVRNTSVPNDIGKYRRNGVHGG